MTIDISKFHVITMISNPVRFASRYRTYEQFRTKLERTGLKLWTCELAYGDRDFVVTQPRDMYDLQLRTNAELWHKERALNLLINRLTAKCPDWQYVAWIDSDIEFPQWEGEKAWYYETVHMLQHFDVIQMFQTAIDLGPTGEAIHTHTGFAYSYFANLPYKPGYANWHPGYCWAIRRRAYEHAPIIDWGVLGSGDRHMACGWIGKIGQSLNRHCAPAYYNKLIAWEKQAERYVRRNIGYLPGNILHYWHGPKKARGYQDRWKILVETQFDPDHDLKTDAYGLYTFADHGDLRSIKIRDLFRKYFWSRREDSDSLE